MAYDWICHIVMEIDPAGSRMHGDAINNAKNGEWRCNQQH